MIPPKPGSGLHQNLQQNGTEPPAHPFWATGDPEADTSVDLRRKRDYRMPPDALESLRATACKFAGSHNFHNFTFGREFRDRSCFRFMKEISVADPVVFGDTEWVSVMFHGQSFMLHQIRKMMSALVLTCRTGSPPEIMDELYGPRMVFVPKMPALGLLLEYPIFETYKQKIAKFNEKLDPSETDYRLPIDFEAHREQLDKFKEKCIYPRMREIESEVGLFDSWMRSIDSYSGNDLLWLNSKGIVPGAAVIQKGVRRADPFKERKHFDSTGYPTTTAEKSMSVADEEAEEEEEALDKAKLEDMEG
ncbi:hypothetical protein EVJ58_g4062 [Rhodofomes roseus]|uniref:tRNA pseudouridine synthase n=1 Tax=Rhodofomes roseus TaxID=34475 RepID=A0A4Y9YKZ5_9APHY|nr:hypothetical protein EVJ58_g4062 [Rhodofomes roseus]